jgi:hypothetical protein
MAYNKKAPTGCTDSNNLHIKSFANGIANMFACSAQHYAWLAYQRHLSGFDFFWRRNYYLIVCILFNYQNLSWTDVPNKANSADAKSCRCSSGAFLCFDP